MGAKRILVTGASGFLGRHCVEALAQAGHHVIGLSRSGLTLPGAADSIACDLLDASLLNEAVRAADAEVLVHFAWHADPHERWQTLDNLDWVSASLALARAFAASGGRRFVFVGSCAEYDWSHELLAEAETPLRPATLYGAAKAATGLTLAAAACPLGISFAWPRVFFCYGPGEPPGRLVPDLIAGLSRGERVACTDGEQRRDFMHAADVGRAIAAIALSDAEGPINVASGEDVAVKELVGKVAAVLGKPELVELGALTRPAGDPARLAADIRRLKALGFVRHFELDRGVRDTMAAFRTRAGATA